MDVNEHMQASDLAGHHGHDSDAPKDLRHPDSSLNHAHAKVLRLCNTPCSAAPGSCLLLWLCVWADKLCEVKFLGKSSGLTPLHRLAKSL